MLLGLLTAKGKWLWNRTIACDILNGFKKNDGGGGDDDDDDDDDISWALWKFAYDDFCGDYTHMETVRLKVTLLTVEFALSSLSFADIISINQYRIM